VARVWLTNLVPPVGLLLVYFVVPYDADRAPAGVVIGVVVSVLAIAGVTVAVARLASASRDRLRAVHLILALEAVVMTFSFAYYLLAMSETNQFAGLTTRLDALYFSFTTTTTVGYGDIHADGQFARALVTCQLAFNLVFVAGFAGILRERVVANRLPAAAPPTGDVGLGAADRRDGSPR
jgi:voltage-gated potassium channel